MIEKGSKSKGSWFSIPYIDGFMDFLNDMNVKTDKKSQEKENASNNNLKLNLIEALYAVFLLIVRSSGGNSREVKQDDVAPYVIEILFAGIFSFLAIYALLYVNLYIAPLLLNALELQLATEFYNAFAYYVLSTAVLGFVGHYAYKFSKYIERGLELRLVDQFLLLNADRARIIVNGDTNKLQADQNQILLSGIPSIIAHVPALIKLIILFSMNLAYAIFNLDPTLIIICFCVGVIAQFLQRKLILEIAQAKKDRFVAESDWINCNNIDIQQTLNINSIDAVNEIKQERYKMFSMSKTKESILADKQRTLASQTQAISECCFYIYLAGALFTNTLTLAEIFMLLPFIKSVSENMSAGVGLCFMIQHVKVQISKMVGHYNTINPNHKLKVDDIKMELTINQNVFSTLFIAAVFVCLQYYAYSAYLKPLLLITLAFPLISITFPKSGISMVYCFVVKSVEYSFVKICEYLGFIATNKSVKKENREAASTGYPEWEKGKELTGLFSYIHTADNNKNKTVKYKFSIFPGHVHQITGDNGVGKTLIHAHVIPGHNMSTSIRINGAMVQGGLFPYDQSLVIHDKMNILLSSKGQSYGQELAKMFGVDWLCLKKNLTEQASNLYLGDISWIVNATSSTTANKLASNGQQQKVIALTALHAAVENKQKYLCFDEYFSGVDADVEQRILQHAVKVCESQGITLAIIHHHKENIPLHTDNMHTYKYSLKEEGLSSGYQTIQV